MSTRRAHFFTLSALFLLSLLLTWPLALHLTTHVPGDGIDDPALAWNLWWVKFALVDHQLPLFDTRWMFFPVGINLAFYTLTVLNGLLSVPLQAASNVIFASNLLLLSSFVLSGYGAFLLALEVQRGARFRYASAFLAAIIYAFASSKLFYAALGQFNIASSQWIPFAALFIVRLGRATSPRAALRAGALAGLFVALQLWAEMTFATFLVILIALFFARWLLAETRDLRSFARVKLAGLIALAAVVAVAALPLLSAMLPDLRAEGNFFSSGGGFADVFSSDVAGYALPTQWHPLLGNFVRAAPFPHDKGQQVFVGFSVLALALLGAWRAKPRTDARVWTLAAALFFWLTLGPSVRVFGQDTQIPGLFSLLEKVPFFNGNRYPSRFSVMLMLSVAALAALGARVLLTRLAARRSGKIGTFVTAALVGLILFEHLSIPLPLTNLATISPVYETIAADPGNFSVLELPLGWRNGARVLGKQDVLIMFQQWAQTVHGKRLLGGNTSRNPAFKFQFFSQAPVLSTLIALTNAADEPAHAKLRATFADPAAWQVLLAHDRPFVADFLRQFDVRYLTLHEKFASPELNSYVETLFPLTRLDTRDGVRLYRVNALPSSNRVALTEANGSMFLGEGWHGWVQPPLLSNVWRGVLPDAAWAERLTARVLLPLDASAQRITLTVRAAGSGQKLRVRIGTWISPVQPLADAWQTLRVDVPAGVAQDGINDAYLEFSQTYPISLPLARATDLVGTTGTRSPVPLFVESAGEEAGDFAHIWVAGRDLVTQPSEPGYHVAVIHPQTGVVEAVRRFNTLADVSASQALADFIEHVETGHIVAVAAADEASLALQPVAVRALASIGATGDLRGAFRWSHAILGVKGAVPGAALEAMGGLQPVGVAVGAPWRSPQTAAAVREIAWEKITGEKP